MQDQESVHPPANIVEALRTAKRRSKPTDERLDAMAVCIDWANENEGRGTLESVISAANDLEARQLEGDAKVRLHYYLANAHGGIQARQSPHEWVRPHDEAQLRHLQLAHGANYNLIDDAWNAEAIFTNLGNTLSRLGRPIAAAAWWKAALMGDSGYGPALTNQAEALLVCAREYPLHEADRHVLRSRAAGLLARAASSPATAGHGLQEHVARLAEGLPPPTDEPAPSDTAKTPYRRWTHKHQLDLDLMNALVPERPANGDPLLIELKPTNTTGVSAWALFNTIKREYASARYMLHQAVTQTAHGEADDGVSFIETLDFAHLGHGAELAKAAFRSAASSFERIAHLLNLYYALGVPDQEVGFRSIWYNDGNEAKGLRTSFSQSKNWPLRGLFWLARDMVEVRHGFEHSNDPDAFTLQRLRNEVEHRFLALTMLPGDLDHAELRMAGTPLGRPYGYTMSWLRFRGLALKQLSLLREAIMYLACALAVEERSSVTGIEFHPGPWNRDVLSLDFPLD